MTDAREQRGQDIAKVAVLARRPDGMWLVPSMSGNVKYTVDADKPVHPVQVESHRGRWWIVRKGVPFLLVQAGRISCPLPQKKQFRIDVLHDESEIRRCDSQQNRYCHEERSALQSPMSQHLLPDFRDV